MKKIEKRQLKKLVYKFWAMTKPNGERLYEKKEIAQMLEIDKSTVARWLEEIGVTIARRKPKLPLDNIKPTC